MLMEEASMQLGGERIWIKASSKDTGGRFAAVELSAQPGTGPPRHVHQNQDEWFYVLEGYFLFEIDGVAFQAGPGTSLLGPRNVPHAYRNIGDTPGRILSVAIPGGLDLFFAELSAATPVGSRPVPDVYLPISEKYGMKVVGPPLAQPAQN